jgi:hypothetical protein
MPTFVGMTTNEAWMATFVTMTVRVVGRIPVSRKLL